MALLKNVPTEILELIYHFLGRIDDVHYLVRTCKAASDVISRYGVYLEIMRSIIYRSPQHKHDFQLNRMLGLHKDVTAYIGRRKSRLPTTTPPNTQLNRFEKGLLGALSPDYSQDALSEQATCEILARYQGLRSLQAIWLERQPKVQDYLSTDDDLDDPGLYKKFNALITRDDKFRAGTLPVRCARTPHTHSYHKLNGEQKGWFHAAVVRVWLLNKIRWVLMHFAERVDFANQIGLLDDCKKMMREEQETPMRDILDEYAVFTFLYHHLLPLHMPFLADRDSSKLPLTFVSDFDRDNDHWSRLFRVCLMAGQVYLQPPDMIDLVLRCRLSRQPPYSGMKLPQSSDKWTFPLPFLLRPGVSLNTKRRKRPIHNILSRHVRLMARCSYHQERHEAFLPVMVQPPHTPRWPTRPHVLDHAKRYFAYQVMVVIKQGQPIEFEDFRAMFGKPGMGVLWEVWWWASSEEQARMQVRRWWISKFV